jgi:L-lysine 6-transaminase
MADQLGLPYPPQAIATGKKLGNGVLYMLHSMADEGVLDSTWGGSLGDMVRFVQELAIVRDERLIEQVEQKGSRLFEVLMALKRRHPEKLYNIRGAGLYLGFSLFSSESRKALVERALQRENLLLLGAGTFSVRLRPNLHVSLADIDVFAEKLERLFSDLRCAP